ncbi:MAG: hypothetical protein ABMA14_24200 [Hyphomonadaceae bacterium]
MLRRIVSASLSIAVVACAAMPAHATEFLRAIDDVPLVSGLTEVADPVVFESDQGRVVRTSAEGHVGGAEISSFYRQTLPALGWKPVAGEAGVYERESERLTLRVREPAKSSPVRVEFELVVKLASSRLPE